MKILWSPRLLSPLVAALVIAAWALAAVEPVSTQGSLPTALVQSSDMTYLGGFDLPDAAGAGDRRCFEYQYPGAMGYNPSTHSLIMKAHDWDEGWAGEVSIPSNLGGTASVRQACRDITAGRIRQINGEGNRVHIGGFLVKGTNLLISGFPYYANGTADGTHMSRSTNFADTAVRGPVRVGSASSGAIGGYMAHIPTAWQAALKGDMLTGQCCISIISRSSFGPSVSSAWFNEVLTQSRPNATTLVNYPASNPLEPYSPHGKVQLLWNGFTRIRGVAFPEGTASVLFFGRHGTGATCYGEGGECKDPVYGDQGEHAYPYQAQVWAYNAHELAQVAAGTRAAHSLKPYAVWALPGMSGFEVAGAVLDTNGRLYVLENGGGPGPRGRVHVYSIRGSGTATPPAADTAAPTVTLTNTAGTVSGTVALGATASDNQGVTSVWFTVNDAPVGSEDTTAPYQAAWSTTAVTNGTYTVRALARDAAGNTGRSAAVTLTVRNTTADATAPSVSLTAPAAGASVSGTVAVSASASDNVGVSSVQFTLNGVNLGSADTTAPYAVNWNTTSAADGAYELRAIARDAAGNATTSASRRVTVSNVPSAPSDTQRPSVSILSPSVGGRVSGTIPIRATASDNVGVARVTIAVDGTTIATIAGAGPYSASWNTTRVGDGSHTITVTAADAAGNSRSTSVSVNVNNRSGDGNRRNRR